MLRALSRQPQLLRTPPPSAARFFPALRFAAAARNFCAPAPALANDVAAPPARFAVIYLGGSQHKVAVDDVICVEKVELPVGATLEARRVLLVGAADATVIGSPYITDAHVKCTVEEQGYGKKVIVFKKKKRKGYRRWKGYRARLSLLRISDIVLPPALEAQMRGDAG